MVIKTYIGLQEPTQDHKTNKSQKPAKGITWVIKKQCTQRTDQPPQNNSTAIDKATQRHHEQEWQKQNQQELAEPEEGKLTYSCKVENAEQRNDPVRKWDRSCQRLAEEVVHQTPYKARNHKWKGTNKQQGFLQPDIIVILWVRANTGYNWKYLLNPGLKPIAIWFHREAHS